MPYGVSWKRFGTDLKNDIKEDNVSNGAAALAFYWMLAIFPAMIFLLSLLPYLPIAHLDQAIMDLLKQALPGDSAKMFTETVRDVATQRKGGLLSVGALLTLWAASAGIYALMQQLNITCDLKESRSFVKARSTAVLMTVLVGGLLVGAIGLVIFGGTLQSWIVSALGDHQAIHAGFALLRWVVIAAAMVLAFAVTYYFGPDVKQKFKFISPGAVGGVVLLIVASLGFKLYVDHFGKYSATYGSIGAVIVLMMWLNVVGQVMLLGSEINALVEHYSRSGKSKGEQDAGVLRERRAA